MRVCCYLRVLSAATAFTASQVESQPETTNLLPQMAGGKLRAIVTTMYGMNGEQRTCEKPWQQLRQGTVQHLVALDNSWPTD